MERHRLGAQIPRERFVDRESGARIDDLVSRVAVHLLGESDRRLRTGEDHDAIWRDFESARLAHAFRDRDAERLDALRIAIVRLAAVDLSFDSFGDVEGKREVRLANIAADHPLSQSFYLADVRADLEGVFAANGRDSRRELRRYGRRNGRHRAILTPLLPWGQALKSHAAVIVAS